MAIIKIKYKAASGSPPTGLTAGELAINLTDREMWVGGTSGAIIRLAGLSANTFTALNTFNAGISAASVRIGTGFIMGACANAEMRMSANGDVSIVSPNDLILGDAGPIYGANENSIEIQRSANSISVTTENFTIGRSGTSSSIKVGASGVTFDGLTATFNRFARFTSGLCASRAVLGSAAASDGVTIDGVLNCSQPVYFNNSISPGGGIYTQSTAFPYVSFPNASLEVAGSSFSVFFAGISASGITVSGRINLPTRPPKTNDTTAATTAFVQTAITEGTVTSVNGKTGAFGISGGQGITTPKLDLFGNLVPAINYLNGGISITQKTKFSEKDVLLFQEASTTNRDIYITSVKALKNYILGLSGSGDTLIPPPGNALQSLSFIGLTQSGDTLTDYVVGFTALQSQVLIDAVTRYNGLTGSVQGVSALNGITGGITLNAGTNIGITFTRAGGITVSVSGLASSDNVVTSFNGLTGAVTGVTVGGANTFSTLQSFSAGISAAGGVTLANNLAVNGGSITTTAATGNVFNTTATTINAFGAATTANIATFAGGITLNIGTGNPGSGNTRNINIGTGVGVGTGIVTVGSGAGTIVSNSGTGLTLGSFIGGGIAVNVPIPMNVSGSLNSTGLLTSTGGLSASGGITFNSAIRGTTATFTSSVVSNEYRPTSGGAGITFGLLSGGGQGNIHFLASEILVGGTSTLQGITLTTVTGVTLTVRPRHNMIVSPINGSVTITNQGTIVGLGTRPSIIVPNSDTGSGLVEISGGNLYLGTRYDGTNNYPTDIIFGNPTTGRVTTLTAPNTASTNKTITLPNATGTVALDAAANTFTALQSFTAGISASGGATFANALSVAGSLNSTGLLNSTGGISASGGVTFNTPIVSTRIPRVSSAVFDTKTANFSPVEADNGKVFVINISGKTSLTVTLDSLSTGWRAKFLVLGGSGVSFTSTGGTVLGTFGTGGANLVATSEMVEVYCYGTNTYFAG